MFVMKKRESYTWPVKFRVAVDGRYEDHEFIGVFKRIPQERLDAVVEKAQSLQLTDTEFSREVLIGWKDVNDETGDAIPFNDDNLKELFKLPGVRSAVIKTFYSSIMGLAEKN